MRTKVQKWGNSLSVRLPKPVTDKAGIKPGDQLEIDIQGNKITLLPARKPVYTLDELMKGVTKKNMHNETDFGSPVGMEEL